MNTENLDSSAKETIEIVLNEFGEELKGMSKNIMDVSTAFNTLQGKVAGFAEMLQNQKVAVNTDTKPIEDIVKKGMADVKLAVAMQPKSIVKKIQILLFPEQDARLFYKIVFGRWFLWLVISFGIANLYQLGSQWLNNKKEIEIVVKQHENAKIAEAWHALYKGQKESFQKKMDKLLLDGFKRDNIFNTR